jgi:hypothetical protein
VRSCGLVTARKACNATRQPCCQKNSGELQWGVSGVSYDNILERCFWLLLVSLEVCKLCAFFFFFLYEITTIISKKFDVFTY